MKLLLVYATTEGQTRKIARFAADRLADSGETVELLSAGDAGELDPARFDAAILAGSLHAGNFQPVLAGFARDHAAALNAMPTMFLPVSLTAADDDPEDREGLEDCVRRFLAAAGWKPGRIEHVAGAFRFSEYDFFKTWAMRWIARAKDQTVKPGVDREYTDWTALGAALDGFVAGIRA